MEKADSQKAGRIVKGLIIGGIGIASMKITQKVMSENQLEDIPEFDDLNLS